MTVNQKTMDRNIQNFQKRSRLERHQLVQNQQGKHHQFTRFILYCQKIENYLQIVKHLIFEKIQHNIQSVFVTLVCLLSDFINNLLQMSDDLKDVRPYINLAESFEDSNPVFSYYLRKYSIQKAHQVYTTLKTTNPAAADAVFAQVTGWIAGAQKLSKQLAGQIDTASNMAEMLEYTEKVFLAADNDYRAKNLSTELTQNLMTAWRFYEVINHFNPMSEDQVKRMKYAKVKAVEVHKALKQVQNNPDQGYKPQPPVMTPGPPPINNPIPPTFNNDFQMQPPNFTPFAPPAFNQPANNFQPSPYPDIFNQPQTTAPITAPTATTEVKKDKKRIDPQKIAAQNQAMTQLQNAISELSFNRIGYAKQCIKNAMKVLEKYD